MIVDILYQDNGLTVINNPNGILVHKTHHAIVTGWLQDEGTLDYDLDEKECIITFTLLEKFYFKIPQRGFTESRYSLVEAKPTTGRFHQIRRHHSPMMNSTT